ncbi:ribosome small subunit-dependent GTPase A [Gloeothece citriformis PCC 7424]|uniref:Small ribosomal subunit biogenesis GTPase RsgA n=1 Tax=Gloeothece citriformis (strain PCC 7424) TaxID=65393 RepID=B7KEJ6_GLOC7|nr:small ribosomal subunit biogenesis GTPase RsgA [Gloeothece citriformis]ACK69021.1 ribosome small subunit-dependent GTPase A [Gloeothece citriformis PCC 7424]
MNPVLTEVTKPAVGTAGLLGTVMAVQANFYQVRLDLTPDIEKTPLDNGELLLLCTRRTRLKKIGQTVMVGDRVLIEEVDFTDKRGAIAQVLPRKTELQRPPVANADQIVLVFALEEPSLDPWQLSRFLVKAESTSLELCLCLNKADLISQQQQQQWQEVLQQWGYDPVLISVVKQDGLKPLLERLKDKISILAGPSGVGKSSLINRLIPAVEQRVNQVSGKLQRGRHTTRHVELFELPGGGLLADTPGFNQPELDSEPTELAFYFPEARQRLEHQQCQFNDCLHRDEPNCVVRGNWERYEYYLKFLEEAIAKQEALQQMPDEESNLKLKIKDSGQEQYEPKLESKKYRRDSRRKKHQSLHQKFENQTLEEIEAYEIEDEW